MTRIPFVRRRLRAVFACACAFVGGPAFARCDQFPLVRHVIVGDTASDAMCGFDDIQSAIDDASTNPECRRVIHVTRMHTYTQQHLDIIGRNVTLAGWGDGVTCSVLRSQCDLVACPLPPVSASPLVTLFGSDGNSVLHIEGTSRVALLNLGLSGGGVGDDQSGGGIYYDGSGALTLTGTTVNLNHAGYGAGINFHGSGGAVLRFEENTQVLANTAAVSGGGVRVEGDARFYAVAPQTLIGFNHAPNGYGGGLEVIGPARADIGSPGLNGLGVFYFNDAQYGGGISVNAIHEGDDAIVRLFSTDPAHPVSVADNAASRTGGGIFLKPYDTQLSGTGDAKLCAFDFRIDDNLAQNGAAIYADLDTAFAGGSLFGSDVTLNGTDTCADGVETLAELGAVRCAPGVACSTLQRNHVQDDAGNATDGATILMQSNGRLAATRIDMRDNVASEAIRAFGEPDPEPFPLAALSLSNCLIAHNAFSDAVVREQDRLWNPLAIDGCTFADNAIASYAIVDDAPIRITNTLFAEGAAGVVSAPTDAVTAQYVLGQSIGGLPADTTVRVLDDPGFVDAAGGNYRLALASGAMDYAGGQGGTDIDGHPRDMDIAAHPNTFGPRDVGAYETQPACFRGDSIFCDGFDIE